MLVILASCYDKVARKIVRQWGSNGVGILTCKDLSISGWNHYLQNTENSTAVVDGQSIAVGDVTGVWTRLSYVREQELDHIIPSERKYVAAEMMAFLVSWLSSLKCPILNRPTPTCLSGPNWYPLQWAYAASRVGIHIYSADWYMSTDNRISQRISNIHKKNVTIIGQHYFGSVDDELLTRTKHLANEAGTDLLSVQFDVSERRSFFVSANSSPYYVSGDLSNAILKYLQEGCVKCS
jgi:hypothetical protein